MDWNDEVIQNHLPTTGIKENELKYCSILEESDEFRIMDIGFGTGVNSLLAIKNIRGKFPGKKITIYGIDNDRYLLDYLNHLPANHILAEESNILDSLAKRRVFESNNLKIRLLDGDITKVINDMPAGFNFVFLDLFSHNNLPWDTSFFRNMKRKLTHGAKLATHTSNIEVRLGLERAGFDVSDGIDYGRGMTGTVATPRKN